MLKLKELASGNDLTISFQIWAFSKVLYCTNLYSTHFSLTFFLVENVGGWEKTVATDFNGRGCFIYGMHGLTIPRKLWNAR